MRCTLGLFLSAAVLFAAGLFPWAYTAPAPIPADAITIHSAKCFVYEHPRLGERPSSRVRWAPGTYTREGNAESDLLLYEDGVLLGPPHAVYPEYIEAIGGGGWYLHQGKRLFFSTSDNSNPRTNGRRYTFRFRRYPPDGVALAAFVLALLGLARGLGLWGRSPAQQPDGAQAARADSPSLALSRPFLLLFLGATLFRAWVTTATPLDLGVDADGYVHGALGLVEGRRFEEIPVPRLPLFSALLALLLGGDPSGLELPYQVFMHTVGLLEALALYGLCRLFGAGKEAATFFFCLAAFLPRHVIGANWAVTEPFFAALTAIGIFLVVAFVRTDRLAFIAAGAVTFLAAALTRPEGKLALGITCLVLGARIGHHLWRSHRHPKARSRGGGAWAWGGLSLIVLAAFTGWQGLALPTALPIDTAVALPPAQIGTPNGALHEVDLTALTATTGGPLWEDAGETFLLLEDGKPLPWPDTHYDAIRTLGQGRYRVTGEKLFFSTTDGSDPRTSARRYAVRRARRVPWRQALRYPLMALLLTAAGCTALFIAFDTRYTGCRLRLAREATVLSLILILSAAVFWPWCRRHEKLMGDFGLSPYAGVSLFQGVCIMNGLWAEKDETARRCWEIYREYAIENFKISNPQRAGSDVWRWHDALSRAAGWRPARINRILRQVAVAAICAQPGAFLRGWVERFATAAAKAFVPYPAEELIYYMDAGGAVPPPPSAGVTLPDRAGTTSKTMAAERRLHVGDLDDDRSAELVIHQPRIGTPLVYLAGRYDLLVRGAIDRWPVSANWALTRLGDFDGDGRTDLFWRDRFGGKAAVWLMDGLEPRRAIACRAPAPAEWQTEGIADFDGDGTDDILYRRAGRNELALWFMRHGALARGMVQRNTDRDAAWQLLAAADLDGDSQAELLWGHREDKSLALWNLEGDQFRMRSQCDRPAPPHGRLATTGDLNGDGKADLFWQLSHPPSVVVWLMDGPRVEAHRPLGGIVAPDWDLVAVADLYGDGKLELLWQSVDGNQLATWRLVGFRETGGFIYRHPAAPAPPRAGSQVAAGLDWWPQGIAPQVSFTSARPSAQRVATTLQAYPAGVSDWLYALLVLRGYLPALRAARAVGLHWFGAAAALLGVALGFARLRQGPWCVYLFFVLPGFALPFLFTAPSMRHVFPWELHVLLLGTVPWLAWWQRAGARGTRAAGPSARPHPRH